RFLEFPFASGQTHAPILDLTLIAKPIVRETKNECAGQALPESALNRPAEDFAFLAFAFAQGIHPKLAQDQRSCLRQHLQTGEIIFKRLAVMQINVEAMKIDVLRPQKL